MNVVTFVKNTLTLWSRGLFVAEPHTSQCQYPTQLWPHQNWQWPKGEVDSGQELRCHPHVTDHPSSDYVPSHTCSEMK